MPDEEVKINPPALHMYTCQQAPGFRLRLKDGKFGESEDIYAEFQNGVWKTDDEELAAMMDKAIARSPHISSLVRKVSWNEARRVIAEATKTRHDMTRMIKGATSTSDLSRAKASTQLDEVINELKAKGTPQAKIDELIKGLQQEGLSVTTVQLDVLSKDIANDPLFNKAGETKKVEVPPANPPQRGPIKFGTQAKGK